MLSDKYMHHVSSICVLLVKQGGCLQAWQISFFWLYLTQSIITLAYVTSDLVKLIMNDLWERLPRILVNGSNIPMGSHAFLYFIL